MADEFLNSTTQSEGWAAIRSLTTSGGQVTGADPWVKHAFTENDQPEFGVSAAASGSDSKIEGNASHGVKVQFPSNTKVIDGNTGAEVVGGSSGAANKLRFTSFETLPSQVKEVQAMLGKTVEMCIPHGKTGTGEVGVYYIVGNISAFTVDASSGNTLKKMSVEVTGASITADTGGDTALAAGPGAVTPVGADEVTPAAPSDVTELKSGAIHLVVT